MLEQTSKSIEDQDDNYFAEDDNEMSKKETEGLLRNEQVSKLLGSAESIFAGKLVPSLTAIGELSIGKPIELKERSKNDTNRTVYELHLNRIQGSIFASALSSDSTETAIYNPLSNLLVHEQANFGISLKSSNAFRFFFTSPKKGENLRYRYVPLNVGWSLLYRNPSKVNAEGEVENHGFWTQQVSLESGYMGFSERLGIFGELNVAHVLSGNNEFNTYVEDEFNWYWYPRLGIRTMFTVATGNTFFLEISAVPSLSFNEHVSSFIPQNDQALLMFRTGFTPVVKKNKKK